MQALAEGEEAVAIRLGEAVGGDAGPARDDLGDVVEADRFGEQTLAVAGVVGGAGAGGELLLQFGDLAVAQLGDLAQVVTPFGGLHLVLGFFQLQADGADGVDAGLLVLVARAQDF